MKIAYFRWMVFLSLMLVCRTLLSAGLGDDPETASIPMDAWLVAGPSLAPQPAFSDTEDGSEETRRSTLAI